MRQRFDSKPVTVSLEMSEIIYIYIYSDLIPIIDVHWRHWQSMRQFSLKLRHAGKLHYARTSLYPPRNWHKLNLLYWRAVKNPINLKTVTRSTISTWFTLSHEDIIINWLRTTPNQNYTIYFADNAAANSGEQTEIGWPFQACCGCHDWDYSSRRGNKRLVFYCYLNVVEYLINPMCLWKFYQNITVFYILLMTYVS